MQEQTGTSPQDTFAKFGRTFQEQIVQSILQDHDFAGQMEDVLEPRHFELGYLQSVVSRLYDYKRQYKTYPSSELLETILTKVEPGDDLLMVQQIREFLDKTRRTPLNGDTGFVQSSSLEFCKKQVLKGALAEAIDSLEDRRYDDIHGIITKALGKGAQRDLGHEYLDGFTSRVNKAERPKIKTPWEILDKEFNGGWERQILATFIAPTGAGKSHFLVNVSAAAVANGYNSLYVTCEMADYKIGLRHDSYFSGVEINNIQTDEQKVRPMIIEQARGRLIIKEFPTKQASVQTIRAYVQRLKAVKDFVPDFLIVDYADLLRGGTKGEYRHELQGVYEDLRALAQEFNCVVVTADQTNRGGLNDEIVTLGAIAESYAKATVCDVIVTISRRMEDKQTNSGRIFIAKSRLGRDGVVYPFLMNPATVKVTILPQGEDPIAVFMENRQNVQDKIAERFGALRRPAAQADRGR